MADSFIVNKALDIIANKLSNVLSKNNNFELKRVSKTLFGFVGEKVVYAVEFKDNKINLIEKNICKDFNDEKSKSETATFGDTFVTKNAKVISQWLFDPESSTEKDAEDIANDFVQVFTGSKGASKDYKTEKTKNESDGLQFFLNRLITLFPELKEQANLEKKTYVKFRYITFIKTHFVPLFLNLIKYSDKSDDKLKKVINVLNNFYKNGNMDVRSAITIVILNSLNPEDSTKIQSLLDDELKEGFNSAYKIKDKKIKPEKLKKTLLSRLLAMGDKSK